MPLPVAIPAAIAIGSAIGGAIKSRRARKLAERTGQQTQQAYQGMSRDALRREAESRGQEQQSRNVFMEAAQGARDFDPQSYARETAGALAADTSDAVRRGARAQDIGNARRGFNSPAGQSRVRAQSQENLNRQLAGLSMDAGRMRSDAMSNYSNTMGNVYNTDSNRTNNYYDAALGLQGSAIGARHQSGMGQAGYMAGQAGNAYQMAGTMGGEAWNQYRRQRGW